MQYPELLHKLYQINLNGGVKLGLDSMRALSSLYGNPHEKFASVHIAGSNGKGTVSAKIAKGLESKYKKVGLYTSPHISSFRERIKINGIMIPEKDVERLLQEIILLKGTFFELTTLLAFLYFAEQGVDIAVLETGLGGRLDATNIVTPSLSVITSISLEHTDILGATLEEIAHEKGGIIKPGVPVILGPRAHIINAPQAVKVQGIFDQVDQENRVIAEAALTLLQIEPRAIQKALTTRLPCRMERIPYHDKEVILDVAHNPDALQRLFKEINQPVQSVIGLSSNKDLDSCLKIIAAHSETIHLVSSNNHRGTSPNILKDILMKQGVSKDKVHTYSTTGEGIREALKGPYQPVVAGTFFIMSEARKFLGIEEPRDLIDLHERFPPAKNSKFGFHHH